MDDVLTTVGQILASGVSIPLGRLSSNYSWRIPLILQCALGVVNVAFVLFLPESPRWLYAKGRGQQAARLLAHLHSRDNDVNSPLVRLELAEIEESISLQGADKRWWDFRPVFRTRGARYRFGLGLIVAVWGQLSGNGLITYFLPMLLKAAGITSPDRQRVLNFVNSVTSFAGALLGTSMVDYVGRRFLMLFAEVSCACGMFIVAGLLSDAGKQSQTRANAGISFICKSLSERKADASPLHGLLLVRMDAAAVAVSDRMPPVRGAREGSRAGRMGAERRLPHQHVWTAVGPSRDRLEE